VVLVLLDALSIIQIYKHIRQVRCKFSLSLVQLFLSLLCLILVGRLLLLISLRFHSLHVLILLPLRVLRISRVSFLALSKRFTRKLSIFVVGLFASVLLFLIFILFLVCVTIVLPLLIVDFLFLKVVLARICVFFLLM